MNYAEFFEKVTDCRESGRCLHELSDILLLVLCGLLADCETLEEIYDYACDKEAVLRQFMALPTGIPSHDTLNRVFRHLNPAELERCLTAWGQHIVGPLAGRHLVIDGKRLRGTTPHGRRQAPGQLASVRATEQRVCLAQTAVAAKRNKAAALPQVPDPVDVAGSVVSLDELGCQRAVAATLVARGADYVLALKQNQGNLPAQAVAHFAPLLAQPPAHQHPDKGHGRGERWRAWCSQGLGLVDAGAGWTGLRTLVCVQTTRRLHGREEPATRYFLSSLGQTSAAALAGYVRQHWGIENHQHWHLDVTFAEDACQYCRRHAPRNRSTLRKLTLTLIQRCPLKMSLKRKRKKAARNDAFLHQLLAQLPVEEKAPKS